MELKEPASAPARRGFFQVTISAGFAKRFSRLTRITNIGTRGEHYWRRCSEQRSGP